MTAVSLPEGSLWNRGRGISGEGFGRTGVLTKRSGLVLNVTQVSETKRFEAVRRQSKGGGWQEALCLPRGHSPAWARGYLRSLSPHLHTCDMKGLTQPEHLQGSFQDSHPPEFRLFGLFFFFLIGVQLIYNVMLVSGVQQSESLIHIHISALF